MEYNYRNDFPVLQQTSNGKPLVYLDNAATSQTPNSVIDAVSHYYQTAKANPHRGAYQLSVESTKLFEDARSTVSNFIGASRPEEVVFVRGSTEAANLLANTIGEQIIQAGDEIVISISEHHSNLIPWQQLAKRKQAVLRYLYLDERELIPSSEIERCITSRTKIVSVGHCSNVLGTENPVQEIIEKSHQMGALVILDGAQSTPHMPVNVTELDADFFFFSGHKMLAPFGIGALYGKMKWLEQMPPFLYGGDMIEYVTEQDATFAPPPAKFEGGTQNVSGAVGLAAAIDYLDRYGMDRLYREEQELTAYGLEKMLSIPYIRIYGPQDMTRRCGIISFNIEGCHPHDVSTILDNDGIAIRSGHHCAQPLMAYLKAPATCRMSLYLYNTQAEIDTLVDSLKKVRGWLGYGS